MKLTLEQIVVLANTPVNPISKSTIAYNTLEDLEIEYRSALKIIDQMVTYRYVERNSGFYNIRPSGLKALEDGFCNLEEANNKIKRVIRLLY